LAAIALFDYNCLECPGNVYSPPFFGGLKDVGRALCRSRKLGRHSAGAIPAWPPLQGLPLGDETRDDARTGGNISIMKGRRGPVAAAAWFAFPLAAGKRALCTGATGGAFMPSRERFRPVEVVPGRAERLAEAPIGPPMGMLWSRMARMRSKKSRGGKCHRFFGHQCRVSCIGLRRPLRQLRSVRSGASAVCILICSGQ